MKVVPAALKPYLTGAYVRTAAGGASALGVGYVAAKAWTNDGYEVDAVEPAGDRLVLELDDGREVRVPRDNDGSHRRNITLAVGAALGGASFAIGFRGTGARQALAATLFCGGVGVASGGVNRAASWAGVQISD